MWIFCNDVFGIFLFVMYIVVNNIKIVLGLKYSVRVQYNMRYLNLVLRVLYASGWV